jgi:hypothetical protein
VSSTGGDTIGKLTSDIIDTKLTKEGVRWLRFDGSMSQAARAAVVEEFDRPAKEPVVLLISLKAGGVGLNLTAANCELVGRNHQADSRRVHDGYMVERGDRATSNRPRTPSRTDEAGVRYAVHYQGHSW